MHPFDALCPHHSSLLALSASALAERAQARLPQPKSPTAGDGFGPGQWHAVEDQLPDADLLVIVYMPEGSEPVWFASYDDSRRGWLTAAGIPLHTPVSHWMHFPEPPVA